MRIQKNDTVLISKGRDRGKRGTVIKVISKSQKLLVEGTNLSKKHARATGGTRQAGIIDKEMPISISNVVHICPNCDSPAKVKFQKQPDGSKSRICKKCEAVIE
ncbi:MAG: 50S ribosomal protein L24 [Dehalococcoidia bacterium]